MGVEHDPDITRAVAGRTRVIYGGGLVAAATLGGGLALLGAALVVRALDTHPEPATT
jgi:hypothetical protein